MINPQRFMDIMLPNLIIPWVNAVECATMTAENILIRLERRRGTGTLWIGLRSNRAEEVDGIGRWEPLVHFETVLQH